MKGLYQVKYEPTDYSGPLGDRVVDFLRGYTDYYTTGGDGLGDTMFHSVTSRVDFENYVNKCRNRGDYVPEQLVTFINRQLAIAGKITLAILDSRVKGVIDA